MSYFKARNASNSISAGAPPQTPLWELTALPHTPVAVFKGPTSEGNGREKRGGGKCFRGDAAAVVVSNGSRLNALHKL